LNKNKLITANIGDDSISIMDIETPSNITNVFLKELKYKNGSFIANLIRRKMGPLDLVADENSNLIILNSYEESVISVDINNGYFEKIANVGKNPVCIKIFNGNIYVLNCDSNSLSIIEEKTKELFEEIYLGEKPTDLQIDKAENKLFIANSNRNNITVLNLLDYSIENIKLNSQPIRIIIGKEDIIVLSYLNNGVINFSELSIINKYSKKITSKSIKGIFIDIVKLGEDLFLLTNPEDGYLYKFKNNDLKKYIFLGGMPNKMVLDDERNYLYVTDLLNNYVLFIDLKKSIITNKIRVGKDPQAIILL
jgi:YVTN family beta-propeller protein